MMHDYRMNEMLNNGVVGAELDKLDQRSLVAYQTVDNLVAQASQCVVESDATGSQATDLAKFIGEAKRQLEKARRELVDPLNSTVKKINAGFKPMTLALDGAKASVLGELSRWQTRQLEEERRRREAEREAERQRAMEIAEKLEAARMPEAAEAVIEQAVEAERVVKPAEVRHAVRGTTATAAMRVTYRVERADPMMIPRCYLVPDMRALEGAAKQRHAELVRQGRVGGLSTSAASLKADDQMVDWCATGIPGAVFSRVVQAIVR